MAKQKFSGNKKMIMLQLAAVASAFKIRHPFTKFESGAARKKIAKQVAGRYGASIYKAHQGEKECARRVAKGQADKCYNKAAEFAQAQANRPVDLPNHYYLGA